MSDSTELAATEQPQTALTVQDRAVIALGGTEREEALKTLAKKYADITEVKNKAGRQQVHAAGMELANERIATKKTGETAREDAVALQKAVIAREKVLIGIIEPEEKRLIALRDKWDEAEEAEKAAKLAAEQQRIADIRQRIADTQAVPAKLIGQSSTVIADVLEQLESAEITLDAFMEFSGEAEMTKVATVAKLREMQAAQLAVEEAAIEAARQAEADRAERERVAEANRVEAQRLADLAAELDRQAIEARARQVETDRQAALERQRVEDEERIARAKAQAVMLAEQQAHEARMAAERAEIQRQQDEINRAKAEQERVEREAREAAEAAARLETDHTEALIENVRIDAERQAAFDAQQQEAQRRADEQERIRREQVQFIKHGPAAEEILNLLADHWDVEQSVAQHWLAIHNWHALEKAA